MTVKLLGVTSEHCFIDGQWLPASAGETLCLHNPSDGSRLCDIAKGGPQDIDTAVRAAAAALRGSWGKATAAERGRILARIGRLVLEHTEDLAQLESIDVGKPLKQAFQPVL